jgi:hypothetical protein
MQEAVVGVVVVVDVACEPELLEEVAVQPPQPLHRHGVGRQTALELVAELVNFQQHGLRVEFGKLVLADRHRRFGKRQAGVFGHQRREILQRGRCLEMQRPGHVKQFSRAWRIV